MQDDSGRVDILLTDNEAAVADDVLAVLARRSARIFQRNGKLVRVVDTVVDGKPTTEIRDMTAADLEAEINRRCRFYTLDAVDQHQGPRS